MLSCTVGFNYLISLRETQGHLGPIVVVRTQEPTWAIPHLTRQNIDEKDLAQISDIFEVGLVMRTIEISAETL